MKNSYEIQGGTAVIFLRHKLGSLECLVDLVDLSVVKSVRGRWKARWNKTAKTYYATAEITKSGGPRTYTHLHNLIMNPPKGKEVDHVHHNGLDNRRSELRVVTRSENCRNKRSRLSGSGIRGVYLSRHGTYVVVVTLGDGKTVEIGCFHKLSLAQAVHLVANIKLDGVKFPSEIGMARKVALATGFSRAYVSMVMRGEHSNTTIQKAITSAKRGILRAQYKWMYRCPFGPARDFLRDEIERVSFEQKYPDYEGENQDKR